MLGLLGLSVDLQPLDMFRNTQPDDGRRPDIIVRNTYGGGKQKLLDVTLSGINGSTRTNDDIPEQPLIVRRKQKESKYNEIANRNGLNFIAATVIRNYNITLVIIGCSRKKFKMRFRSLI